MKYTYIGKYLGPGGKPLRFTTRAPLDVRIEAASARLAKLDERIGKLMSQRVAEEENLAHLLGIAKTLTETPREK